MSDRCGRWIAGIILGLASALVAVAASAETITAKSADGVTIYGETYFDDLDEDTALVVLFHQGGSNGRGEYGGEIAPWLNTHHFRAIAWDQRSGGSLYGSENRTVAGLPAGANPGYCDAMPDLEAALKASEPYAHGAPVIAWGSSYSAALVFRLAARHGDDLTGIIAFSPASGGQLRDCSARDVLDEVKIPVFALRPASEMERESVRDQVALFKDHGVRTLVVPHGIHGSSMLVDARTESDMSAARQEVLDWLNSLR